MRLISFFVLSILFSSWTLCQDGNPPVYIKIEQFKIANVTLGSELAAALHTFGKTDSIARVSKETDSLQEDAYYFKGVVASISEKKVCRLECINPKYKTFHGIRVGDDIKKLFEHFGKADIWKMDGKKGVTYVLWPPSDTYMTFEFHGSKISKILLEFSP